MAGCSLGLLVVAATLRADPSGSGTHQQLGLPACGWMAMFNRPCPACGMTTAFAHAASGNLVGAALAQPFGTALAVTVAAAFWVGAFAAVTGSPAVKLFGKLLMPRFLWVFGAFWAVSWAYKVAVHRP